MIYKLGIALAALVTLLALSILWAANPANNPVFVVRLVSTLPGNMASSWQLLSNTEDYPRWNPYLIRVEGDLVVGNALQVELIDGSFDGVLSVTPRLSEMQAGQSFCWRGTLVVRGAMDTRHCFVLQPAGPGIIQIEQYEEFSGLLPRVLPMEANMAVHVQASFKRMHEAMRVELQELER